MNKLGPIPKGRKRGEGGMACPPGSKAAKADQTLQKPTCIV